MKKVIFLTGLLLFITIVSNGVLAVENLEKDFMKLEELYEKISKVKEEEKSEVMAEIIELSDELVEKYPDQPKVYWEAASNYSNYPHYVDLDNPIEAFKQGRKYARNSIELAPKAGRGYFWEAVFMGQIAQEKGIMSSLANVKPMKNKLEKAIELEPDFAPSYDVMAQLYIQAPGWPVSIGDDEKALEYRKKSVELAPQNYNYQWRLYENYREVGKDDRAKKVLQRIIEMIEAEDKPAKDIEKIRAKVERELEKEY